MRKVVKTPAFLEAKSHKSVLVITNTRVTINVIVFVLPVCIILFLYIYIIQYFGQGCNAKITDMVARDFAVCHVRCHMDIWSYDCRYMDLWSYDVVMHPSGDTLLREF